MFVWIDPRLALVSSRRDLDASKRGPENLDPKTGMLGLTPAVVFMRRSTPPGIAYMRLATP